eukprot:c19464_g1_i1.p1 GENE.c19464_g1_i1~~c19464_g1_i1.p1  ORF type:complete len:197 (-),score=77.90 c19464_g1_i1:161-751(-)
MLTFIFTRKFFNSIYIFISIIDSVLGNSLIHMYSKCGKPEKARQVFDLIQEKDITSWTAIINAYGVHGEARESLLLFEKMQQNGILPNDITFTSLLNACSNSGLVFEAINLFEDMEKKFGLTKNVVHYTCIVDLLARAGRLDEAKEFINSLEIQSKQKNSKISPPNVITWVTLLCGCSSFGDVERIERIRHKIFKI